MKITGRASLDTIDKRVKKHHVANRDNQSETNKLK
jgi:hypothetical protein